MIAVFSWVQKIYYSLQQQKVKSVKCKTTITELVAVWSLYNVCTSVTKSKVVTLKRFTLFAIVIARSRKISVVLHNTHAADNNISCLKDHNGNNDILSRIYNLWGKSNWVFLLCTWTSVDIPNASGLFSLRSAHGLTQRHMTYGCVWFVSLYDKPPCAVIYIVALGVRIDSRESMLQLIESIGPQHPSPMSS